MEKLKRRIKYLEDELLEKEELIKHLEKINEMHVIVEELSRKEEIDYDKTIEAHEKVSQLSTTEMKESERIISAHSSVEQLSLNELKQRDRVLATVLRINRQINSLQPEGLLLKKTLTEVITILDASRGLIILKDDSKYKIKVKQGFSKKTTLPLILEKIDNVRKLQQGGPHVIANGFNNGIVTQLKKKGREIGVIYLEKESDSFKNIDREFLDIIGSQVSTALNNSHLFTEAKLRNRELKKAIMMNKSLIDHLSYDFKKPLDKLSKTLQKNLENKKDIEPQLKEAIRIANWITNATDRILCFSSLKKEVNEMFSHNISIDKIVHEIIDKLKPRINEKNLKINIHSTDNIANIEGNRNIFQVIFDEIITNAVVYNKTDGEVNIQISQEKEKIIVIVADTGLGVKKKSASKIFERFYREPSSYENYKKGAGLGLFIVKKFIENYSGSIEFKSKFDHGSEIKITLPV